MRRLLLILFILNLGGLYAQSPGGEAANLVVWLRCDEDVFENAGGSNTCEDGDNVAVWGDQTANNLNAEDFGVDPEWIEVGENYNPSIDFGNTTNGGLRLPNNGALNSSASSLKTIIMAFRTGADINTRQLLYEHGNQTDNMSLYIDNGELYANFVVGNNNNHASGAIESNTSYVVIWVYDGVNTDWEVYVNGTLLFSDNTVPATWPGQGQRPGIGRVNGRIQFHNNGNSSAVSAFEGEIMELAYYNNDAFDAAERDNMFSYLGAKYGITLNQDYNFASGGAVFWDQSANSAYHNEVAGIIRDDISDLDQRQAKSANEDAIVSVGNGALASGNLANPNALGADQDYFFWGNNDGAISFTSTGAPANRQILGRTWKIQENGSGTIEISVPDNSSSATTTLPAEEGTVYLLADTDPNFSTGATEVAMSLNGTDWETTTDLSAFTYFTFATSLPVVPGGITTTPTFWLKGDAGTFENAAGTDPTEDGDNVAVWADQTSNANDAEDSGADPSFLQSGDSYNPTVDFSSAGGGLTMDDDAEINTGAATQKSFAIAFKTGDDINSEQAIYEQGDNTTNIAVYIDGGELYCNFALSNSNNASSVAIDANTSYILVFVFDGASTDWYVYLNGTLAFQDLTAPSSWPGENGDIGIGRVVDQVQYHSGNDNGPDSFDGWIHEMVYFNDVALNILEIADITSYLGIKYGVTLDQDYNFAAGGSVFWDQGTNSAYHNDVAGWIREDANLLYQNQAKSASSDAIVSVANLSLASDNTTNANVIGTDENYFMWGNNDGALSFSATGAPANRVILGRTWLIQENGSGNVEISASDNSSSATTTLPQEEGVVYLLADTDADFSTGATEIAMTLNGTEWEATANLSAFNYFTFASQIPTGPGGVAAGLTVWLRADTSTFSNGGGTTPTNDGDNVAVWADVSGNANDAFDDGTDPIFREVYNSYQPTVDYSTINGGLGLPNTAEINTAASAAKTFVIAFNTGTSVTTADQQMIFEIGDQTDAMNVYISGGSLYCNFVRSNANNANSVVVQPNTAYVLVFVYDGGNSRWDAYLNGVLAFSDASVPTTWPGENDGVGLGRVRGRTQYHNDGNVAEVDSYEGQIHEFLLYDGKAFNTDEVAVVSSYLAVKYGITLENDYEGSFNDPLVWDNSLNTGYNNDIAGIGRDDFSALDQLQSISANSDAMVSIARNALATSNALNGNSFTANKQYLIWGNNNGSVASFSTAGAPPSRQIIGRVWQFDTAGVIGNVEISVPGSISASTTKLPPEESTIYLLLDTDANFSTGATEVALSQNGTEWETTINLAGFRYFTFATETAGPAPAPLGPGGVGSIDGTSSLSLWLDASTITGLSTGNNVTAWEDQSGNNYDAAVSTNAPSYSATGMGNGRPGITFDAGNTEDLFVANNIEVMPTNELSVFVAGNMENSSDNWAGLISTSDDNSWNDGWGIARDNGNNDMLFYIDDYLGNVCDRPYPNGQDEVYSLIFNTSDNRGYGYISEDDCDFAFNGPIVYNGGANDDLLIGSAADNSGPDYFMDGDIGEVIIYDEAINDAQRIIVANYLAAKYDINLSSNNVYDQDNPGNGDYDYDVAGIGQTDASNAHLDAQGTGIVRISDASNLGNNEFLIWGHDNGDDVGSQTIADAPAGVEARLNRVWRVSESNVSGGSVDVGSIRIRFDLTGFGPITASDLRLIVDANNNNDFTDDIAYGGASLDTLNTYQFTGVTAISDNLRFTIGTANQLTTPLTQALGPGGVFNSLNLWLRSDQNTSTTADNTPLNTWSDVSPEANDGQQDGNAPTYRDNLASNFNFYPTVDFDGVNDRMVIDLQSIKDGAGNGDYSMFVIGERDDASFNIALGSEGGSNNQDLHFGYRSGTQATLAHWGNDLNVNVLSWNAGGVTPYLLSGVYDGTGRVIEEFRNGGFSRNTDGNTTDLTGTKTSYLGDLGTVSNYNGRITEVAVYSNDITALEKLQVYTYFILKYGLNYTDDNNNNGTPNQTISGGIIEGDLVASDGTTKLWDYTAMGAAYFNDIAGIGYDTLSGLNHKQSRSLSTDALVTMGLGTIASSNLTNASSFNSHLDFLVWGNDNGALTGVASNVDLPAQSGVVNELQRLWKIAENGNVGNVQVAFPKSDIDGYLNTYAQGALYLRVADDANLSVNAVDVALTEVSINGELSYACTHDFNGTQYFTVVRKGFIVWDGSEWRGGLSLITDHAPSDEVGDAAKPMFILSGDTAVISEPVVIDSLDIASTAVLHINPSNCLRTSEATNAGEFVLDADATGFAQYKGPAISAKMKQYVDNEGWHLIGSPFSDATWGDLEFENSTAIFNHPVGGVSADSCNYCNLWWYDSSVDNGGDIGFMASTAYGTWRTSSDNTELFTPTKGWNMFFDADQNFGAAPWTILFSGTLNDGPISQSVNENNSGWNLVANPYPTVLDWDVVDDDLASENIALGYHVWDHTNTNFAVYANGSGTLGATQYIAPLQGFYVQTATAGAQGSANVLHNFNLDNNDRPDPCQNAGGNIFKGSITDKEIIRIRTTHMGSGKMDEMVVQLYDGAVRNYSPNQDIRKLLTNYADVPSVYARKGQHFTAITALPRPYAQDSLPLGIYTKDGSEVKIEVVDVPTGYSLFLEDVVTGKWYSLDNAHSFTQDGNYPNRFVLHFAPGEVTTRDWTAENPFDLHIDADGLLVIQSLKRIDNADWVLYSMSGQAVATGRLSALNGTTDRVFIGNLRSGVYIFALTEGERTYSEKLPKIN